MVAVKSGKFEKHRKVYLFKKKKKKKDNHTYVKFHTAPVCIPGNLHGVGLTVLSGLDPKLGPGLHSHFLCPVLL